MGKDEEYYSKHSDCPFEAHYLGDDRKAQKQKKKLASANDRSKYKKTDQDQLRKLEAMNKRPENDAFEKGRVLSIVPEGILVESESKHYLCLLRGVLKKEKGLDKNLVTVGDFVLFEITGPKEGSIAYVEPRKSVLSRADNLSRRKNQLIAANIDQVIITASVVSPLLKPSLIDRYIIAARKGGLEPIIVINKLDLLEDSDVDAEVKKNEKELYEHLKEVYQQNSLEVIGISILNKEGMDALKNVMQNKASVFSGQSGVGKSSLINTITGSSLRIGDIVERTQKGSHTTTTATLLPLEFGGWCIDTPGIKSFGIWDLKQEEIEGYFTEIHQCGKQCHFPNCTHTHETDCAVMQAVDEGKISIIRYNSYITLLASISEQHKRR